MTTTVATAVQVTLDPGKLNQENLLLVGAGWKELGIAGHGPESIKVIRKCFEAGRISKDGTVCMRRVRNGAHMEGSTTCLEELINDPSITYLVPTADTVDKCKIDGSVLTGRIYYRSNPNREWNPFPSINDIPEIVAQDPKLDAMLQNSKDSEHLVWMMKSNDYPCMPSLAAINLMRNDFWLHLINGEIEYCGLPSTPHAISEGILLNLNDPNVGKPSLYKSLFLPVVVSGSHRRTVDLFQGGVVEPNHRRSMSHGNRENQRPGECKAVHLRNHVEIDENNDSSVTSEVASLKNAKETSQETNPRVRLPTLPTTTTDTLAGEMGNLKVDDEDDYDYSSAEDRAEANEPFLGNVHRSHVNLLVEDIQEGSRVLGTSLFEVGGAGFRQESIHNPDGTSILGVSHASAPSHDQEEDDDYYSDEDEDDDFQPSSFARFDLIQARRAAREQQDREYIERSQQTFMVSSQQAFQTTFQTFMERSQETFMAQSQSLLAQSQSYTAADMQEYNALAPARSTPLRAPRGALTGRHSTHRRALTEAWRLAPTPRATHRRALTEAARLVPPAAGNTNNIGTPARNPNFRAPAQPNPNFHTPSQPIAQRNRAAATTGGRRRRRFQPHPNVAMQRGPTVQQDDQSDAASTLMELRGD